MIILVPGIILTILRFYSDIKIALFDIKVFAIYSSFFESKYFTFVQNNYTEEAAGTLLMIGLIFIAFSKETIENKDVMSLRLNSLLLASYLFLSLVLLTILFVFGFAFLNLLIADVFIFPAAYIIIFRFNYRRYISGRSIKRSASV